ncbi:MAG: hypothetical protein ACE5I8_06845 [Thermodesulfobacteriota bacterium]
MAKTTIFDTEKKYHGKRRYGKMLDICGRRIMLPIRKAGLENLDRGAS